MWNILDLVLGLVLLMYCLLTVVSKESVKTDGIVGRVGGEVTFSFNYTQVVEEYNKISSLLYGKRIIQDEIQIEDLRKESVIKFKNNTHSTTEYMIYENGKPTSTTYLTEIFMSNDAFVVKKTKLQKEDAGIYSIKFRSIPLRKKALVVTGKPTIKEGSPPNPVLKPEDNYTSNIHFECHSVSTSIGEYPLTMYTVWYKNGMRMTDVDLTLSQINVTVDHNGGTFTCLATDYLPCYQRLQTTKQYNVLNIEECDNVFESKNFIVQPEYPPIGVTLEPDQRVIIVNRHEDLLVRCSANCHPKCDVIWKKEVLGSNGSIFIIENLLGNDLKIVNINSSHEGFYFCLVNNSRVAVRKGFSLCVREIWERAVNNENMEVVIGIVVAVVVTIVIVIVIVVVIACKGYHIPVLGGRYTSMLKTKTVINYTK